MNVAVGSKWCCEYYGKDIPLKILKLYNKGKMAVAEIGDTHRTVLVSCSKEMEPHIMIAHAMKNLTELKKYEEPIIIEEGDIPW